MRKTLFILAILLPMFANALKIEKDVTDEFTGLREVVTSWEALTKNNYVHIRFRLHSGVQLLDFKFMTNKAIVIGEGDKLMFKSNEGEISTFQSVALYHGGRGDGAVGTNGSGVWGIFATYSGDIKWFQTNIARLMRINSVGEYTDRDISEKDGQKLQDLANLFIATIDGDTSIKPVAYNIQYLKKKKSGREWDLVKEENNKLLNQSQLKALIDEWEAKTTDQTEFKVSVKKAK